jgi:hypothetical protein
MQVVFESRDPEGAEHREHAVQRLRFALRRLSWLVPRVRVQLADINGPRGGVDKRCRLELKTDRRGSVVVTAVSRDWRSAIDEALHRAARTVLRSLRRGQPALQRTPKRVLSARALT